MSGGTGKVYLAGSTSGTVNVRADGISTIWIQGTPSEPRQHTTRHPTSTTALAPCRRSALLASLTHAHARVRHREGMPWPRCTKPARAPMRGPSCLHSALPCQACVHEWCTTHGGQSVAGRLMRGRLLLYRTHGRVGAWRMHTCMHACMQARRSLALRTRWHRCSSPAAHARCAPALPLSLASAPSLETHASRWVHAGLHCTALFCIVAHKQPARCVMAAERERPRAGCHHALCLMTRSCTTGCAQQAPGRMPACLHACMGRVRVPGTSHHWLAASTCAVVYACVSMCTCRSSPAPASASAPCGPAASTWTAPPPAAVSACCGAGSHACISHACISHAGQARWACGVYQ